MNNFALIILLLSSLELYSFQVINIYINEDKDHYSKFIDINDLTEESIIINLHTTKKSKIKEVSSRNVDLEVYPKSFDRKRKKREFRVIKPKNSSFKKREVLILRDYYGKEYFITLSFYSQAINIDSTEKDFHINYNKSDYPVYLYSSSCVIGNYLIVDENLEIKYKFQLLSTFGLYLDALKNGEYLLCEDQKNNKLFSFKVDYY